MNAKWMPNENRKDQSQKWQNWTPELQRMDPQRDAQNAKCKANTERTAQRLTNVGITTIPIRNAKIQRKCQWISISKENVNECQYRKKMSISNTKMNVNQDDTYTVRVHLVIHTTHSRTLSQERIHIRSPRTRTTQKHINHFSERYFVLGSIMTQNFRSQETSETTHSSLSSFSICGVESLSIPKKKQLSYVVKPKHSTTW